MTETDSDEMESFPEKAVVYILHYYDDFNVNKQRGDILKDFLIKTSLYNSVKTIEDELASSLDDVHGWVSDVLKERTRDGRIQKIILIDSKEEDEVSIGIFKSIKLYFTSIMHTSEHCTGTLYIVHFH